MSEQKSTWTREHDLGLVYLSLAYGTDRELSDYELATITDVLQAWREDFPPDEVQEVVMEAVTAYLENGSGSEVLRAVDDLRTQLSPGERRQALKDVMRIAEADGVLLSSERSLISSLASKWDIKADGLELLAHVTAEEKPSWTLLHDVGLMYFVMAHSTDNSLSEAEIEVMIARLLDWQPELSEEKARKVLREVLAFYSQEPDRDALQESVNIIREMLPSVQRLALIDDLVHIAEADGPMDENKQRLLASLSKAWGVGVRLEG